MTVYNRINCNIEIISAIFDEIFDNLSNVIESDDRITKYSNKVDNIYLGIDKDDYNILSLYVTIEHNHHNYDYVYINIDKIFGIGGLKYDLIIDNIVNFIKKL